VETIKQRIGKVLPTTTLQKSAISSGSPPAAYAGLLV
jgi:hypothetical protein